MIPRKLPSEIKQRNTPAWFYYPEIRERNLLFLEELRQQYGFHYFPLTTKPERGFAVPGDETQNTYCIYQIPTFAQLEKLLQEHPATNFMVPCDHFVQAEAYSLLALKYRIQIDVNVLVNPGNSEAGGRPGRDSADLAYAISQLKGIRFTGFQISWTEVAYHQVLLEELSQSFSALKDCLRCLIRWELKAENIILFYTAEQLAVVSQEVWFQELCQQQRVVIGLQPAVMQLTANESRLASDSYLLATIISRPHSDQAILNLGTYHLGDHRPEKCKVNLHGWIDAELMTLYSRSSCWKLGSVAMNLLLGDVVGVSWNIQHFLEELPIISANSLPG